MFSVHLEKLFRRSRESLYGGKLLSRISVVGRDLAGKEEKDLDKFIKPEPVDFKTFDRTEWSEDFEGMCRWLNPHPSWYTSEEWDRFKALQKNRLFLGRIRYGRMADIEGGKNYDYVQYIEDKLYSYVDTGNRECLVDAGNSCLLEYVKGHHPSGKIYDRYKARRIAYHGIGEFEALIERRIEQYREQGKVSFLGAMWCMFFREFSYPTHPVPVWEASDDSGHYKSKRD